ncbi:hypothetical protein DPMN_069344 [Dreissena polymorpha]|uniref:Uncharacterized protein n=1 Tax=Dreissena polymorpha TaxID=45954 RepID=A0A9D4BUV3_DREPO|nr:hypothetical protein DPMN_069344 [Dreissena polymorpha]
MVTYIPSQYIHLHIRVCTLKPTYKLNIYSVPYTGSMWNHLNNTKNYCKTDIAWTRKTRPNIDIDDRYYENPPYTKRIVPTRHNRGKCQDIVFHTWIRRYH